MITSFILHDNAYSCTKWQGSCEVSTEHAGRARQRLLRPACNESVICPRPRDVVFTKRSRNYVGLGSERNLVADAFGLSRCGKRGSKVQAGLAEFVLQSWCP